MKTGLRAALTTNVNPAFFGLTCLLLISVLLTAKVMADELWTDEGYCGWFVAVPNQYPWLAVN